MGLKADLYYTGCIRKNHSISKAYIFKVMDMKWTFLKTCLNIKFFIQSVKGSQMLQMHGINQTIVKPLS